MNDPLADLKDIHLPDPVSWWPLAPGWWISMAAVILTILLIIICFRLWKKRAYRRLALHELNELDNASADYDVNDYLEAIAGLIRRTALAGPSNEQLANWQGVQWQQYLQQHMPEAQAKLIAVTRYQADPQIDKQQLTHAARQWIKRHKA